jgi:WD40 repeat protein/tRNA A-37 threonylcarbamoyl transferase component Bud32
VTRCPTGDELRSWLAELLPGPERVALEAHVDECSVCQATLDTLLVRAIPTGGPRDTPRPGGSDRDDEFLRRLQAVTAGEQTEELGPSVPFQCVSDPKSSKLPDVPGYEVQEELGRGGMGVVFKARHLELNRLVALKLLRVDRRLEPSDRVRLRTEAAAAARLQHPDIVQIYDTGECEAGPYLTMELVPGGSLAEHMRGIPQPARDSAELVARLARAIHYAHEHGVLHRDLKPANILLNVELRQPKIADFGLARWLEADSAQTPTDAVIGTPCYMAPELAERNRPRPGPAADVYGLGAVLYDMLTGRPPFRGDTVLDTLVEVLHEEPIAPSKLRPKLPGDLEIICLKCLRKEPGKRYFSALAIAEDLDRFLTGRPILARPVGPLERGWRWARRNSIVTGLAAALMVAVAAGFGGITWKWLDAERLRKVATDEAGAKEQALSEVNTNLYYHSMALAHRELLANNVDDAEHLLDSQPPERRGWEWHYLKRLCHPELLVLNHPTLIFHALGFTPDGRHLVASNPLGHVEVRCVDGQPSCQILEGTSFWIAPERDRPATILTKSGRDLITWNTATGKEAGRRQLVHHDRSPILGYSANGQRFATASPRGEVAIWDVGNGAEICTLQGNIDPAQMRLGPAQWMTLADFSPDGKRFALPCDKVVKIFDTTTGQHIQTLGDGKSFIWRVTFRPDGGAVAVARQDGAGVVWDTATGREICRLHGHTNYVRSIVFSPDGERLATSSYDKTVRLWDAQSGAELATYRGHTQGVHTVAFSPDGTRLASACQDRSIRIWDATHDPRALLLSNESSEVRGIAITPDGRKLLALCADGTLVTWDLRNGSVLSRRPLTARAPSPVRIAFSPDGRWCAVNIDRNRIQIWDVERMTPACPPLRHTGEVLCLSFSPDGTTLATGTFDRMVKTWDVATGRELQDLGKHSREIRSLQYLPDGNQLAVVTWEGAVTVWSLSESRQLGTYNEARHKIMTIAPAANGRCLVLGAADGQVVEWDPATDTEVSLVLRTGENLTSLTVSPDGRRLAAAVDSTTVKMWSPSTGHECIALRTNGHKVLRVLFTSDGNRLVTLDSAGIVKAYSATSE